MKRLTNKLTNKLINKLTIGLIKAYLFIFDTKENKAFA